MGLQDNIYEQMKMLLKSMEQGEQLPTRKEILEYYGISIKTLKTVMRRLRDENLIYHVGGKGVFKK